MKKRPSPGATCPGDPARNRIEFESLALPGRAGAKTTCASIGPRRDPAGVRSRAMAAHAPARQPDEFLARPLGIRAPATAGASGPGVAIAPTVSGPRPRWSTPSRSSASSTRSSTSVRPDAGRAPRERRSIHGPRTNTSGRTSRMRVIDAWALFGAGTPGSSVVVGHPDTGYTLSPGDRRHASPCRSGIRLRGWRRQPA